jgi:hypothetical protein
VQPGWLGLRMASACGKRIAASGQMVVGDDEVEAEPARGFRFGKGAHAGVDGDHERTPSA